MCVLGDKNGALVHNNSAVQWVYCTYNSYKSDWRPRRSCWSSTEHLVNIVCLPSLEYVEGLAVTRLIQAQSTHVQLV